jgi:DNA (cytosine-5)-methyltransferase 1
MNKPEYIIPTMEEIAAIRPRHRAMSTFSGCGGSTLGYRMAGFDVFWANEFVPAAREVYQLNNPTTLVDARDIREIHIREATGIKIGDLELLDGSPPCAAFSGSGKGAKLWGKEKSYSDKTQRVDDLFEEYIRFVDSLQPWVFVAENVAGMMKGAAQGYFKQVLQKLRDCGYNVKVKLLGAHRLGVPQARERLIFVGVRNDFERDPVFPLPMPYRYTVREILPYVKRLRLGGMPDKWRHPDRPSPTIFASDADKPESAYFSAGGWIETENERRKFTIEELKIICSFPADFQLTGTYAQQWERLGRAVPPLMMRAIAQPIATLIDEIKESRR